MSAAAIVMMVVTILLVWGGLVASIVALRGGNAALSDEAERGDTPASLPEQAASSASYAGRYTRLLE